MNQIDVGKIQVSFKGKNLKQTNQSVRNMGEI